MDVPEATLNLLRKKKLSNAVELRQCTEAAKAVRDAMSAELSPGSYAFYIDPAICFPRQTVELFNLAISRSYVPSM